MFVLNVDYIENTFKNIYYNTRVMDMRKHGK